MNSLNISISWYLNAQLKQNVTSFDIKRETAPTQKWNDTVGFSGKSHKIHIEKCLCVFCSFQNGKSISVETMRPCDQRKLRFVLFNSLEILSSYCFKLELLWILFTWCTRISCINVLAIVMIEFDSIGHAVRICLFLNMKIVFLKIASNLENVN